MNIKLKHNIVIYPFQSPTSSTNLCWLHLANFAYNKQIVRKLPMAMLKLRNDCKRQIIYTKKLNADCSVFSFSSEHFYSRLLHKNVKIEL
jgi:hypothetical protein